MPDLNSFVSDFSQIWCHSWQIGLFSETDLVLSGSPGTEPNASGDVDDPEPVHSKPCHVGSAALSLHYAAHPLRPRQYKFVSDGNEERTCCPKFNFDEEFRLEF